jgi:hypothetical protein
MYFLLLNLWLMYTVIANVIHIIEELTIYISLCLGHRWQTAAGRRLFFQKNVISADVRPATVTIGRQWVEKVICQWSQGRQVAHGRSCLDWTIVFDTNTKAPGRASPGPRPDIDRRPNRHQLANEYRPVRDF